jgi:acetolactate synthase-1/2/3 large subunit
MAEGAARGPGSREGAMTGAEALLRALSLNGIDYLFANPGSDFAPIIEAYASAGASRALPEVVTAPHENICVSMAHGYWLATGRMQAAAVHVNVGLANAVCGMINARADDVPVFLLSGRTPLTEHDRPGARRTPIQYGQEMFDQTALVRECCKWEYELRYGETAADLVARAAAIARSEPQGPVYLSLPREPLCETVPPPGPPVQSAAAPPQPDPGAVAAAARALATARAPLIVCSRGDAEGHVGAELAALAEENAIAVSEVFVTRNVLRSDHPCAVGGDLRETMRGADTVLVVDSGVAWIESLVQPEPGATVIHLGPDPLFARMPVRGYRTDLALQCNAGAGLAALRAALPGEAEPGRLEALRERNRAFRKRVAERAEAGRTDPPSKAFVAAALSRAIGPDGVVFSERGGPASSFSLAGPNRWFGNTQAGGLGWCLPAALGYQLADRSRQVACVVGDGSYLFANPVACHQVALSHALPLLTVVLDNAGWDAVRGSTLEVYPDGQAARLNAVPMAEFGISPDHAAIAAAAGCHAERVSEADALPGALDRALGVIGRERLPAVLVVAVAREG